MATDSMMPRGVRDASEFDFRLQHPFSCVISGPSNSGKTYFVKRLMEKFKYDFKKLKTLFIFTIVGNLCMMNCLNCTTLNLLKEYQRL